MRTTTPKFMALKILNNNCIIHNVYIYELWKIHGHSNIVAVKVAITFTTRRDNWFLAGESIQSSLCIDVLAQDKF